MAKIKDNVWSIFGQGLKLYFTNFGSFFKYMAFPVFGQILGIVFIYATTFFYSAQLPKLIVPGSVLDNYAVIFFILFLLIFPGFFIFIKAFWDYLVAYGAINSMLDNMLKSGRVYDFHAHNEIVTRRNSTFVGLWVVWAVFGLISGFPLFWLISGILSVYFVLVFQVFTFEPDKTPIECFKKSFVIIKGNFARTVLLLTLLGGLTYWILPETLKYLLDVTTITGYLAMPFDGWAQQLPIDAINNMLLKSPTAYQITSLLIAKTIVGFFLSYIVTCMTLPLRSICCALWYKSLNKEEMKLDKRILDRAEKGE